MLQKVGEYCSFANFCQKICEATPFIKLYFPLKYMAYPKHINNIPTIIKAIFKASISSPSKTTFKTSLLFLASTNPSSAELYFPSTPILLLGFHG